MSGQRVNPPFVELVCELEVLISVKHGLGSKEVLVTIAIFSIKV